MRYSSAYDSLIEGIRVTNGQASRLVIGGTSTVWRHEHGRTDKGAPLRDSLVDGECTLALISALARQDISREALTSFKVVRNYVVECATDGEVGR